MDRWFSAGTPEIGLVGGEIFSLVLKKNFADGNQFDHLASLGLSSMRTEFLHANVAAVCLSTGIGYTSIWVVSITRAGTAAMVGSFSKIPLVVISTLLFRDHLGIYSMIFCSIGLVGAVEPLLSVQQLHHPSEVEHAPVGPDSDSVEPDPT
eukprot:1033069-Rhodomonas_salina.2